LGEQLKTASLTSHPVILEDSEKREREIAENFIDESGSVTFNKY